MLRFETHLLHFTHHLRCDIHLFLFLNPLNNFCKNEIWRMVDASYKATDIFTTIKEKFSTLAYTRPILEVTYSPTNEVRDGKIKIGTLKI
jgi:hypothetical protein